MEQVLVRQNNSVPPPVTEISQLYLQQACDSCICDSFLLCLGCRDQEATARNVRRLEGVVGGLTHAWQAELDVSVAQQGPAAVRCTLLVLEAVTQGTRHWPLVTWPPLPACAPLQEVEAQIPVLLGDSTLAAAAVVYLGALQPAQRAAALQAWHALLQVSLCTAV
jgi:hypothetical protein